MACCGSFFATHSLNKSPTVILILDAAGITVARNRCAMYIAFIICQSAGRQQNMQNQGNKKKCHPTVEIFTLQGPGSSALRTTCKTVLPSTTQAETSTALFIQLNPPRASGPVFWNSGAVKIDSSLPAAIGRHCQRHIGTSKGSGSCSKYALASSPHRLKFK
jgi:hypothetical protein